MYVSRDMGQEQNRHGSNPCSRARHLSCRIEIITGDTDRVIPAVGVAEKATYCAGMRYRSSPGFRGKLLEAAASTRSPVERLKVHQEA